MTTARARNYAGLSARGAAGRPARAADRGRNPRLWRTRIPQYHREGGVRGGRTHRALFLRVLCQQRGAAGRRLRGGLAKGVRPSRGGAPGAQGHRRRARPCRAACLLPDTEGRPRWRAAVRDRDCPGRAGGRRGVGRAVAAAWRGAGAHGGAGQRHQAEAGRTGARRRGRRPWCRSPRNGSGAVMRAASMPSLPTR